MTVFFGAGENLAVRAASLTLEDALLADRFDRFRALGDVTGREAGVARHPLENFVVRSELDDRRGRFRLTRRRRFFAGRPARPRLAL